MNKVIVIGLGLLALGLLARYAPPGAMWFVFGANFAGYLEGYVTRILQDD